MEELLSIKAEIEAAVEEAQDSLPQARYNTGMLRHLCQRMVAIKGLDSAMLTKNPQQDSCQEYLVGLKDAAVKASALVKGHAKSFQIGTYYKVDYVRHCVEQLCAAFRYFLLELGIQEEGTDVYPGIEVDAACVEKDREYLHQYLTCILEGSVANMELPAGAVEELRELIVKHRHRMEFVNRIQERDIAVEEQIGEGGFGNVVKGTWNGVSVAVKQMKKELSPEAQAEFYHEVEMHIQLNHPNVVRCYGATSSNAIVMELALTNLEQMSWSDGAYWTWGRKVQLMTGACKGLAHLHKSGVVHRDVKTSNFLVFGSPLGDQCIVKICDFGLSVAKAETRSKTGGPHQGTALWMAPEVVCGAPHDFASDMFSFGLVLYELATVSPPYRGITEFAANLRKKEAQRPAIDKVRNELEGIQAESSVLEADADPQRASDQCDDGSARTKRQRLRSQSLPGLEMDLPAAQADADMGNEDAKMAPLMGMGGRGAEKWDSMDGRMAVPPACIPVAPNAVGLDPQLSLVC
eukprot:evm.model.scf_1604.1 EVM.evm.TU.scf_1604.1   scf_1604:3349-7510(-)